RLILFFIAVMLSSAAVAVAGSISFIGLMGPHIAKRIVGPRHAYFHHVRINEHLYLFVSSPSILDFEYVVVL
ncbi:iron chelate uptake ABC transporter family permease subunit, partial [Staphylococcus aureus]|uniref:iron chelate uptake ABC transporter family permease subunit n=1 Tax=Staphylococcus aureus TaxID=1280 RepID=UPI00278BC11F